MSWLYGVMRGWAYVGSWVGAVCVPPARGLLGGAATHDRRCRSSVVGYEYTCASGTSPPDVGAMQPSCVVGLMAAWCRITVLRVARCGRVVGCCLLLWWGAGLVGVREFWGVLGWGGDWVVAKKQNIQ